MGRGKWLFVVFMAVTATRLACAYFLPITTDESYYFLWSRYLDLGYFDHPPVVAWISSLGALFAQNVFAYRLGGFLLQLALFPLFLSLCQKSALNRSHQVTVAALLMFCNFFGCMVGIITTPDTPFIFAWTLALHEAAAALDSKPRRWLTAGLATALGLWSKYAMLLIGPVFLWALIRKRGGLKSPWPYLGGILCLLLFLPHLYWNSQNNWVSFGFQISHGIKGSHEVAVQSSSDLPAPLLLDKDSPEYKLGQYFLTKESKPKKPLMPIVQFFRRVMDFTLGQLMLWGVFLIVLLPEILCRLKKRASSQRTSLNPQVTHLLLAGSIVPLAVFGILSFSQKVEANWPAIYTVSGSILLASFISDKYRLRLLLAATANLLLILGLVFHANHPFYGKSPAKDRVLLETHGFANLADHIRELRAPVLADSYQIISMLAFYAPEMRIAQWPGITRFSELTRRKEFAYFNYRDLLDEGHFWLITLDVIPPRFRGFTAQQLIEAKDCPLVGLKMTYAFSGEDSYVTPCSSSMHQWYLVHYRRSEALTTLP